MKYLVLVSHGEFAAGLKTSLMMLAGQRDDVIASGLPDGKTADEFAVMPVFLVRTTSPTLRITPALLRS